MRSLATCSTALLLVISFDGACARSTEPRSQVASTPAVPRTTAEPWLELTPGARFTIRQTIDITRPDGPADHRDARLDVEILERTPDGHLTARAVLDRPADPVPIGAMQLVLEPDGSVVGSYHLVCGGVSDDDVRRTIPHLIGLLAGPTPTLRSELATARVGAESVDVPEGQAFGALVTVDGVRFFRLSLTGTARTTATVQHDPTTGARSAHVRADFAGSVLAYGESDMPRDTEVSIDERIEATVRPTPVDLRDACARAPLSTADVRAAMQPAQDEMGECWQRELDARPDARGQLVLNVTVQPDGSFTNVHVTDSTIESNTFSECLVRAVSRQRAPHGSPSGPASFTFPWNFVP